MLNKKEIEILKLLMSRIREDFTISEISRRLKQKYSQTYNLVRSIRKKGLVKLKEIGRSSVVQLDFSSFNEDFAIAELELRKDILRKKEILAVFEAILRIDGQFTCILFGSYAKGKQKRGSDIDLLFITDGDSASFERKVKNTLSLYNVDINVIRTEELFDMWSSIDKINVANEMMKGHRGLFGVDNFVNLLRKHYAGR
jgi:predicted nucleotidyltransferase